MIMRSIFLVASMLCSALAFAAPVNINTANSETIAKSLNGIGPGKAAAIVQYRTEKGPFKSVEELKLVKGIGQKILEKVKTDILLASKK